MILSVVIPFHTAHDLLDRVLASLLCQMEETVELIATGDGVSGPELQELQTRYPLVRITCIPKSGANAARMHGLAQSQGDYVLFVDSDDTLPPGAIQTYLSLIRQWSPDLIVANTKRIQSSGVEEILYRFKRNNVLLDKTALTVSELYTFPILINKCFKKSLLANSVIPDSPLFQDASLTAALFLNAHTLCFSNQVLYHYHVREGSTSSRSSHTSTALTTVEEMIHRMAGLTHPASPLIDRSFVAVFSARLYFTLLLRSFDLHSFPFSEGLRRRGYQVLKKHFTTLVKHPKTLLMLLLFSNTFFSRVFFYLKYRN